MDQITNSTISASDVARYILNKRGAMTGYQIQKLLYYCQAWSLVINGKPLFSDEIQAWQHGPVIPSVSRQHQNLKTVYPAHIHGNPDMISLLDQRFVDEIMSSYGELSGDALEALTHSETPWKAAYNGHTGSGAAVITLDAMRTYYVKLYTSDSAIREAHYVPKFDNPQSLYVSESDYQWLLDFLKD